MNLINGTARQGEWDQMQGPLVDTTSLTDENISGYLRFCRLFTQPDTGGECHIGDTLPDEGHLFGLQ